MWMVGRGDLKGHLIVISGPSGSGKSTLVREVLNRPALNLQLSISATTRAPRPGEVEGRDYFFVTRERFQDLANQGEGLGFLEWAEYNGNYYGTTSLAVIDALRGGKNVILEIEVQGAEKIRDIAPTSLFLFVRTRNFSELERRLRARHTEAEGEIHRRLVVARRELAEAHWYDDQIINDDLEIAVEQLTTILIQHGCGG